MYKVIAKGNTGYKGKRLTDETVNSYPQRLLDIWEKSGIIAKVETKKTKSETQKD